VDEQQLKITKYSGSLKTVSQNTGQDGVEVERSKNDLSFNKIWADELLVKFIYSN